MNKQELINIMAEAGDISKAAANRALDACLSSIVATVAKGDVAVLVGFGSFDSKEHKARTGRNPQTGEPIQIPAATVPRFKAGKAFKDAVNK